jgi:hypothetical protein
VREKHQDRVFAVRDRTGREIVLTQERWSHIQIRHPEVQEGYLTDIERELVEAYEIHYWPDRNEEWHYLKKVGPTRWLKVVIVWDDPEHGRIITMFPRRSKP